MNNSKQQQKYRTAEMMMVLGLAGLLIAYIIHYITISFYQ
jgi:hypothetical protein